MSVPNFIKIGWKLRPWERGETDRRTDRDNTCDHGLCGSIQAVV